MDFGAWDRIVRFVEQAISGKPLVPAAAVEVAYTGG